MKKQRFHIVVFSVILLLSVIWCLGILIAPLWHNETGIRKDLSVFFYEFYGKSCHQIEERSVYLKDHPLGVCSRCTAIYFAFLLGALIYPVYKKLNNTEMPSIWLLILASALIFLDVTGDMLGVYRNSFLSREITGGIMGFVLPFYIIPGTIRLFDEFFNKPDLAGGKN